MSRDRGVPRARMASMNGEFITSITTPRVWRAMTAIECVESAEHGRTSEYAHNHGLSRNGV